MSSPTSRTFEQPLSSRQCNVVIGLQAKERHMKETLLSRHVTNPGDDPENPSKPPFRDETRDENRIRTEKRGSPFCPGIVINFPGVPVPVFGGIPSIAAITTFAFSSIEVHRSGVVSEDFPRVYNFSLKPEKRMTWKATIEATCEASRTEYCYETTLWYPSHTHCSNRWLFKLGTTLCEALPAYIADKVLNILGKKPFAMKVYQRMQQNALAVEYFLNKFTLLLNAGSSLSFKSFNQCLQSLHLSSQTFQFASLFVPTVDESFETDLQLVVRRRVGNQFRQNSVKLVNSVVEISLQVRMRLFQGINSLPGILLEFSSSLTVADVKATNAMTKDNCQKKESPGMMQLMADYS
ncbi:unnamed protein product [Notodromas monacha]|uniref:Uncharacterized protein n=1 Tax=Notodromas monacha TaxID=399045 RepID=A0A7R9G970_9CRUS|nr:unnamed protein product [Notodromas monacha]CAG0914001.1 unnamed protein product [Notodromas monacha]